MTAAPTVLMPAFQRIEASRRALASLRAAGAPPVIFIDDEGSAGGEILSAEYPGLDVIRTDAAAYWTGGIVLGIRRALERGESAVLFFNQDVTVAPDYFLRLSESVARSPAAILGSVILYAQDPGRVWSGGGGVEWWGRGIRVLHHGRPVSELPAQPYDADWLFGMGTYVPVDVFETIGLPDAKRFPMSWGDTDFTLRAKAAGRRVRVDPALRLFHEVGDYDARAAGPPSAARYVSWLRDDRHNLSLSAHAEIWRRHGPRGLWPVSLALRTAYLLANYVRIRLLFPGEGRA